ncbi:hypothetical protein [Pontixanthobacter sp.]|uniref:hypothetical protein n=1 Tax=Pontixanthobacter sp. TaxID=2792078 RepID=UPI003C7A5C97
MTNILHISASIGGEESVSRTLSRKLAEGLAAQSGGTAVGSAMDFMTPWLTFFLGFLGIHDAQVIAADGIMGADGGAKIAAAHEAVEAAIG